MRVAMVSEHASPLAVLGGVDAGGQNVAVAGLASAMARQGTEVVVHTRRDDPAPAPRVRVSRVVVDHVDAGPARHVPKDELMPYMDDFAVRLFRAWRAAPPDVVHAHFWMSGRAALKAARPLGIPVVQTFHALGVVKRRHQGDKDTSHPGRIVAEQAIMRRVDAIVATCTDEVTELEREGADLRRVSVVPCGVDLGRFTPHGAAEPQPPHGRRRLVMLGRLVERKGIEDALVALARIPDAELVVGGGPVRRGLAADPEARRLLEVARQHGVADRLDLRGSLSRDQVPPLLRSADAVLCVPWYEPFGIVPLEAMACGTPVIAAAVGGMLDSVVHGDTGLHVPPRDPRAIADAVCALMGDRALWRRLSEGGVRRAQTLYGWDRVAAETLGVYRAVTRQSLPVKEVVVA
jgi:D-inositol-3-phosphate glycosyltransferase